MGSSGIGAGVRRDPFRMALRRRRVFLARPVIVGSVDVHRMGFHEGFSWISLSYCN